MKKLLLCLAAVASLSACKVDSVASAGSIPAPPLQGTTVDEKSLLVAIDAYEVALTGVDKLVAAGVLVRGTPKALAVKGFMSDARDWLNAAAGAQKAGSTTKVLAALANAQAALSAAGNALK
jgi:hypothetical protein